MNLNKKIIESKAYKKIRSLTAIRILVIVLFISVLAYAGAVIPGRLVISPSISAGHRLFFYKPNFHQSDLKTGQYVFFEISTSLKKDCRPCTVVKQIACDEGENLTTDRHRNYYCSDTYIGTAKTNARDGTPLRQFIYTGPVPPGKIFAAGNCVDSYDSRYFGFVDKKDVKAIVVPII